MARDRRRDPLTGEHVWAVLEKMGWPPEVIVSREDFAALASISSEKDVYWNHAIGQPYILVAAGMTKIMFNPILDAKAIDVSDRNLFA